MLAAASLELKAEKQSAHSKVVRSVAFSPDGKTIVSGSDDRTLKVWDAGTSTAGTHPPDNPPGYSYPHPNAESLNELSKVENADPDGIMSVQFAPGGKTIVSGGLSGTLKVWDAGASLPLVLPRAKLTSPTNPPPQPLSS